MYLQYILDGSRTWGWDIGEGQVSERQHLGKSYSSVAHSQWVAAEGELNIDFHFVHKEAHESGNLKFGSDKFISEHWQNDIIITILLLLKVKEIRVILSI